MIFVIVAFVVLILFLFMIFTSVSDKRNEVIDNNRDNGETLLPIKENVDFCLKNELRRALLIAGNKGGFIYEDGEYYTESVLVNYSDEFLTNMDLNSNNLLKTLVHSQYSVYSPSINRTLEIIRDTGSGTEEIVIYGHTIEEDFEIFLNDNFMRCMDLDRYEKQGYNVSYEKYVGSISQFDDIRKQIIVDDFHGMVGDSVKIPYENQVLTGEVVEIKDDNSRVIKIPDDSVFLSIEDLSQIYVINMNSSAFIDVTFTDESVKATLSFPIRISGNDNSITFKESEVELNVRFKKLLQLSNMLLNEKVQNRSLDYTNEEIFQKVIVDRTDFLSKSHVEGKKSLIFDVAKINNSPEYKKYVYYFIDRESRILGNDYVFKFGYENHAPKINLSLMDGDSNLLEENVLKVLTINSINTFSLMEITSDEQLLDSYTSNFEPDEADLPRYWYKVESDGTMKVKAKSPGFFDVPITVTDNEATRTYTFSFMGGLFDNSDNSAVSSCIELEQNDGLGFAYDIENDFKGLFNYDGSSGDKEFYGFVQYLNPAIASSLSYDRSATIIFKRRCIYSETTHEVHYSVDGSPNTPIDMNSEGDFSLEIPNINSPKTYVFSVYNIGDSTYYPDPFVVKIYPVGCMGPHPLDSPGSEYLGSSKKASCCNTEALKTAIASNNPQSVSLPGTSVLYSDGSYSVNTKIYICTDLTFTRLYGSVNPAEEILWNSPRGSAITSLFQGNLRMVCNGKSSIGELQDISSAGGSVAYSSILESYFLPGIGEITLPTSVNFRPGVKKMGGVCKFCYVPPVGYKFKDSNGVYFNFGVADYIDNNPSLKEMTNVTPLISGVVDYVARCDNNIYGRAGGGGSWGTGSVDGVVVEQSNGFCPVLSSPFQPNSCTGRTGTPGYKIESDDANYNWRFVSGSGLVRN